MTRRRGRRRKKLLDDLKDSRGYCELKEEALDRTVWRNRFGRGCGPVVWQITDDDDDDVFLFSILCILCFCIVLCIVYPFVLRLSYLCTSLPTSATVWKPNCSKQISYISYHIIYIISYRIISYHISYHTTSQHIISYIISHHITAYHIIYHIISYKPMLRLTQPHTSQVAFAYWLI